MKERERKVERKKGRKVERKKGKKEEREEGRKKRRKERQKEKNPTQTPTAESSDFFFHSWPNRDIKFAEVRVKILSNLM